MKAGLASLVDLPIYSPDIVLDSGDMPVPEALINNVEYWDALMLDPVGAARKLVTAARASGQRRENFEAMIVAGNEAGGCGDPPERLRVVGLLKDVETRWSATFLMVDRVLEQYLVSYVNLSSYCFHSRHRQSINSSTLLSKRISRTIRLTR